MIEILYNNDNTAIVYITEVDMFYRVDVYSFNKIENYVSNGIFIFKEIIISQKQILTYESLVKSAKQANTYILLDDIKEVKNLKSTYPELFV